MMTRLKDQAGRRTTDSPVIFVSSINIFPTLVELAGGTLPDNLDGRSLVPVLNGKSEDAGHAELLFSDGRDSWVVRKGPCYGRCHTYWWLLGKRHTLATKRFCL
jgi:arylsulfatase A-like enzyme